jgi:hypothetical protein
MKYCAMSSAGRWIHIYRLQWQAVRAITMRSKRWLKEAFEQRSMSMVLLGVEPFFETLRGREPMRLMAKQVGQPFSS